MLVIRDKEAGNAIETVKSLEEGRALIAEYENQDKTDGTYSPDFYEVAAVEEFEAIGNWWADSDIELVRLSDGNVYALNEWNGEIYGDCWKCTGDDLMTASSEKFVLRPVYEEDENGDYTVVDYEVE